MMGSKFSSTAILITLTFLALCGGCSRQSTDITSAKAAESVPEDREIASALSIIEKSPELPMAYNQLAILYIRRARQTGDFALNTKAESAVRKALEIAPGDGPSRKML